MTKEPLVSIIIPVYNGDNFLSEAINSALNQSYKNTEIIVVNDGSTDDGKTEEIIRSYGDKVRYIRKENGGSSSALNVGIRNMNGDYFSWLSHDDVYYPDRTKRLVELLEGKDIKKTVSICGFELIDEQGIEIFYPKKFFAGNLSAEQMLDRIQKGFNINGCGICISKNIMKEVGFFDETLRYVNDTDYWYRLINLSTDFICTDERLVGSRIHDGQVSVTSRDLYHVENRKILQKYALYTLKNNLHSLASIYMKRCAFLGYRDVLGSIKTEIQNDYEIQKQTRNMNFTWEFCKGALIRLAKRLYQILVWKR